MRDWLPPTGLAHVVHGSQPDRLHGRVDRSERRDDDHGQAGQPLPEPAQQREAVHLRHLDVEDGELGRLLRHSRQCAVRIRLAHHRRAVPAEDLGEEPAGDRVVVDDQDALHHPPSGSRTRMVVP